MAMGFTDSLKRELGKNTGKFISNKVFGDGHSTPYRMVQRDRAVNRQEREDAIAFKLSQQDELRQLKERERQLKIEEAELKEEQKQQRIKENEHEVNAHNSYIKTIQSVHRDYALDIDWVNIINQKAPEELLPSSDETVQKWYREYTDKQVDEKIIMAKGKYKRSLASYILEKYYQPKYELLFKITDGRLFSTSIYIVTLLVAVRHLYIGILVGSILGLIYWLLKNGAKDYGAMIILDNELKSLEEKREAWYREYLNEHQNDYLKRIDEIKQHHRLMKIANGVIKKDDDSYIDAIDFFKPFDDLKEFGSDISYENNVDGLCIEFYAKQDDVIPRAAKSLTKKGLEIKEELIPTPRFNEIYQDYVCSCVLRIGKEIFALLPIEEVKINVNAFLLNTSTGKYQDQLILSGILQKNALNTLNFEKLDPSDSMANFKCNMNFKKSIGFLPVEELT